MARKLFRWPVFAILGGVVLVVGWGYNVVQHSRQTAGRLPCPSNLREIGQGILLYANDHGGSCPESLGTLVAGGYFPAKVLRCPDDSAVLTTGETSYIHLRTGQIEKELTADDVVAYEPLRIHEEGGNVLFGDGHVAFIDAKEYPEIEKGRYVPESFRRSPSSQFH